MIDYYECLGIALDAEPEDVKKAFKKASLRWHPDKVQGGDAAQKEASEKFNELTRAREVLEDPERRKTYDTFGIDLGEDRPEMEVWTIGLATMASPLGTFLLKTFLARVALWVISFVWVGRILMLLLCIYAALYALNFTYKGTSIRNPEMLPFLLQVSIVCLVIIFYWVWPLLSETVCVLWLLTEITGAELLLENFKIGGIAAFCCMIFARLSSGWWFWIIGAEVLLGIVLLVALTIASGIMRLWIDQVETKNGDKVKQQRLGLRKEMKKLRDEASDLRSKLNITNLTANPDIVAAQRKKLLEDQGYWEKKLLLEGKK